jgi:TRAP-type C4-dicarboxylate transport system substrate-binding protein
MRKNMKKFCATLAILFLAASPLFAQQKVIVKLASLIPENTAWGAALNRMSAEWSKATNGEVELVVYHNGVAGDEGEVFRKLKINQINAAIFTSIGLYSVMPEVMTLSYPFLIRTEDEFKEVLRKLGPDLDARIKSNGFVTLAWTNAGWIKLFSRSPIFVPADARTQKVGSSPDLPLMTQAFKMLRYQIVPVGITDLMTSLNSGMIDTVYMSPIMVAGSQIFAIAKNMSSLNLCPFMGGMVVHNATWRRIPEKYRPKLMEITQRIATELDKGIIELENEAISTMVKFGLVINQASPAQEREWINEFEGKKSELLGPVFDTAMYNKIDAILKEYRKEH